MNDNWLRQLIAPLLSAAITGGAMYVAVKTELASVSTKQQLLHDDMNQLRSEFISYRADRLAAWEQTRERLASIEARLAELERHMK